MDVDCSEFVVHDELENSSFVDNPQKNENEMKKSVKTALTGIF